MSTTTNPATALYDQAKARSVIAYWTHVRVRHIDAESVTLMFGQDAVEITQVTLTVTSTRDARRLAVLLDLPPEAAALALAWRTWTGWISAISAHRPVLVRIIALTGTPQET